MIEFLFKLILTFVNGGLSAFHQPEKQDVDSEQENNLVSVLSDLIKNSDAEDIGVIKPFEVHMAMSIKPGYSKTPNLFVEGFLLALNSVCDEISQLVPESTFETSVSLVEENKATKIYEGSIRWTIDNVNAHVYPVCIDLLRDGFMFKPNTQSFVITTRISS